MAEEFDGTTRYYRSIEDNFVWGGPFMTVMGMKFGDGLYETHIFNKKEQLKVFNDDGYLNINKLGIIDTEKNQIKSYSQNKKENIIENIIKSDNLFQNSDKEKDYVEKIRELAKGINYPIDFEIQMRDCLHKRPRRNIEYKKLKFEKNNLPEIIETINNNKDKNYMVKYSDDLPCLFINHRRVELPNIVSTNEATGSAETLENENVNPEEHGYVQANDPNYDEIFGIEDLEAFNNGAKNGGKRRRTRRKPKRKTQRKTRNKKKTKLRTNKRRNVKKFNKG